MLLRGSLSFGGQGEFLPVVLLSVTVGNGYAYGDVSRFYPAACVDAGGVFYPVARGNLLYHYGRGDVDAFRPRGFSHYGDYVVYRLFALVHNFENHLAAFVGADYVVAAVVYEAYVTYPQLVEGGGGGSGSGLRYVGFRPFYPVTVFFLFGGGEGVADSGSGNGSDNRADSRAPVAASPAVVRIAYQSADSAAYVAADSGAGKYRIGVARYRPARTATAAQQANARNPVRHFFISFGFYSGLFLF